MRRRYLAIGAVLIGLLSGCSSGGRHASAPATTLATASSPNPDVVPAVITPAYVNAVFRVLEHIDGNASRALIAAHAVTQEVTADIRAIYNDPLYAEEVRIAEESVQGDLSNVKRPLGDVRVVVTHLISSSPTCVFLEATSDYTEVVGSLPAAPASEYWELEPKQAGADPDRLNPTPWSMSFNRTFQTPTELPNQCGS